MLVNMQHFLLFPKCFLPFPKQISLFWLHCHLQTLSIWTSLKFCHLMRSEASNAKALPSSNEGKSSQHDTRGHLSLPDISMDECNTILSADTMYIYRHLVVLHSPIEVSMGPQMAQM